MKITDALLPEFDQEMATTRRTLERVPEDKMDWRPHEKSMTLGQLACHIAELPGFASSAARADSLDFEKGEFKQIHATSCRQLLEAFDQTVAEARSAIASIGDEELMKPWVLRRGDVKLFQAPKAAVIRTVMMNHLIHHRGQLSVYLRLTNTPVPSIYGPSADEGIA
ncbi:MAG TPA: DinB family protein [Bryobacteraceae bacterium]|jgi:uncharacterized damage-inducible protein DinB|nr:DinB family protein [Bryobacteraceae bacterium]